MRLGHLFIWPRRPDERDKRILSPAGEPIASRQGARPGPAAPGPATGQVNEAPLGRAAVKCGRAGGLSLRAAGLGPLSSWLAGWPAARRSGAQIRPAA